MYSAVREVVTPSAKPAERMVNWIYNPDDFNPSHLGKIIADITDRWTAQGARHGFGFQFIPASELTPTCVDRPRLWRGGVDLLETRQCYIVDDIGNDQQAVSYLHGISRIIDASDSFVLNHAMAAPEWLERDKLAMIGRAAQLGLKVPKTVALPFRRHAREGLEVVRREIGGGPYILKARESGTGFGVLKVDTFEQLRSAVDIAAQTGKGYLVQEFLPNSGDLRVALVEGEVVTSMLREQVIGRYLSNIAQGGNASPSADFSAVLDDCLRVVRTLGADYLCVDFLITEQGPVFGEWCTVMANFSQFPEPARSELADAFFHWAGRLLEQRGRG
ncbi:ATP-grasp domain-containing protein [Saccharopolyspora hattusasensis]|uniref:ATP-grasp domain-containing protein n=1 Tax=Saccharopolyspora hattusasensis TaxID=1128679 RepID=UPI003D99C050